MDRIHDKGLIYVKNIEDEIVFGDSSCDVLFNGYHNAKEEKLEGPGICIWQGAKKQVFVGVWDGPTLEGYGLVYNDQERYIGNFKDGKFEGMGKRSLKDDKRIWEGHWVQNHLTGLSNTISYKTD